ncbi:MAG: hypothetical protein PHE43_00395 [Candidatus Nanoarchaeia archaeon]|nr:hypothetical protein [Candidatus Nanoarchaeia archaeon]
MNKKAMAMETVAKLILAILSFLIIFVVLGVILIPTMNDSYKDAVCKFSMYLTSSTRAGTGISPIKIGSAFNLNCPMHEKTLKYKDPENVMKLIADESVKCWGKFGEGNVDFYSDVNWPWKQDTAFCIICTKIEPKNSEYETTLEASEFVKYLGEKEYSKEKMTYLQYLYGGEQTSEDIKINLPKQQSSAYIQITEEKPLYILFRVTKSEGGWIDTSLNNIGEGAISFAIVGGKVGGGWGVLVGGFLGGLGGSLFTSSDFNPSILYMNSAEVASTCDELAA